MEGRFSGCCPVTGRWSAFRNPAGVLLLAHTMGIGKLLKIDGLPSVSPLSNSALYSAEPINNRTFNIYEIYAVG
jgi:hypothetical protein